MTMDPQEFSSYVDDLLRKLDHPFLVPYQYCLGKNLALLIDNYNAMHLLTIWKEIYILKNETGLLPYEKCILDKVKRAVEQWQLDIETPPPDDGTEPRDEESGDEDDIEEAPTDKPVSEKWLQKQKEKKQRALKKN